MSKQRRAIYIAIDKSGSMDTNDRIGAARRALAKAVAGFDEFLEQGNRLDVALCFWSGAVDYYREWRDITRAQVDEILEATALLTTQGTSGTDYSAGTQNATAFFTPTLAEEFTQRKFIFLTDGENFGSAGTTSIADLLDRSSGAFQDALGTAVDCHAAAISGATGSASNLDNTASDYGQIPNLQNTDEVGAFLLGTILPLDPARAWPGSVNWRQSVRENYSFRTEVLSSRDGTEQRIAQRAFPRSQLTYQSDGKTEEQSRAILQRLHRDQGGYFFIPHPGFTTTLTGNMTPGASTMSVDSIPSWATPGQPVVLSSPDGASHLDRIMQTNPFVLAGQVGFDFPPGSRLTLALKARFATNTKIRSLTSDTVSQPVTFEMDSGDRAASVIPAAPATLEGEEFFDKSPNWARPVENTFMQAREIVDFKRGVVDVRELIDRSEREVRIGYLCKSREEIAAMVEFFHRIKGAQRRFYCPLWVDELRPIGDTLAGENTMTFAGRDVFDSYAGDSAYRHISVTGAEPFIPFGYGLSFGDAYGSPTSLAELKHAMQVSLIRLDSAGNSVIEFANPLNFDLKAANVRNIHWVAPVRSASDRLSMEWLTTETARTELTLKVLRETPGTI